VSAYGFAASAWNRGADGVYLFNWMDSETRPVNEESYRILLQRGLSVETSVSMPRRHPVCYRDTVPADFSNGVVLPVEGREGGLFQIHIGPKPASGNVCLIAGLSQRDGLLDAIFHAEINSVETSPMEDLSNFEEIGGEAARALRFRCPSEAVRDGYNEIRIRQNPGAPSQQVVWIELQIDQVSLNE
jgi:hypothetical protein